MKNKTPVRRRTSHLLTFQSQKSLGKKSPNSIQVKENQIVQLTEHPERKEDLAHFIPWGLHFVMCVWNPVLKESYSWLVLDSPRHSWVTTEEESQTSSRTVVQMPKDNRLAPSPEAQSTENRISSTFFSQDIFVTLQQLPGDKQRISSSYYQKAHLGVAFNKPKQFWACRSSN